jgi:hypothetical protein
MNPTALPLPRLFNDTSGLLLALIYAGVPCVMKLLAIVWLRDYPLKDTPHATLSPV